MPRPAPMTIFLCCLTQSQKMATMKLVMRMLRLKPNSHPVVPGAVLGSIASCTISLALTSASPGMQVSSHSSQSTLALIVCSPGARSAASVRGTISNTSP